MEVKDEGNPDVPSVLGPVASPPAVSGDSPPPGSTGDSPPPGASPQPPEAPPKPDAEPPDSEGLRNLRAEYESLKGQWDNLANAAREIGIDLSEVEPTRVSNALAMGAEYEALLRSVNTAEGMKAVLGALAKSNPEYFDQVVEDWVVQYPKGYQPEPGSPDATGTRPEPAQPGAEPGYLTQDQYKAGLNQLLTRWTSAQAAANFTRQFESVVMDKFPQLKKIGGEEQKIIKGFLADQAGQFLDDSAITRIGFGFTADVEQALDKVATVWNELAKAFVTHAMETAPPQSGAGAAPPGSPLVPTDMRGGKTRPTLEQLARGEFDVSTF